MSEQTAPALQDTLGKMELTAWRVLQDCLRRSLAMSLAAPALEVPTSRLQLLLYVFVVILTLLLSVPAPQLRQSVSAILAFSKWANIAKSAPGVCTKMLLATCLASGAPIPPTHCLDR